MALQHARLQLQGRKLILEALQEPAFHYQGQTQRRLVLELETEHRHELRLGPYALQAFWDAQNNQVCVQLELVDAAPQVSEARDEARIFGPARGLLSRRQMAWAGLLLSLGLFVLLPMQADSPAPEPSSAGRQHALVDWAQAQWNSGPISAAHGHFSQNCQACHRRSFERVPDQACLDCHSGLHNHAAAADLQQAQPSPRQGATWIAAQARQWLNIPQGRCASCHAEHNGHQLTQMPQGFCVDCHQALDDRLPDTALQNAGAFPDQHPAFRPSLAQLSSMGKREWLRQPATAPESHGVLFNHAQHLDDPEVARKLETLPATARAVWGEELDCQDCHTLVGPEQEPAAIVMETHCADCHQLAVGRSDDNTLRHLPHGDPQQALAALEDAFLAQSWRQSQQPRPQAPGISSTVDLPLAQSWVQRLEEEKAQLLSTDGLCGQCHPAQTWEQPGSAHWPALSQDYFPAARFPHAPHVLPDSQCSDCHAADQSEEASTVLMPALEQCSDCHRGPQQASTAPSTCLDCHGYHGHPEAEPMQPQAAPRSGDAP
jgi:hypothetical protein